MRLREHRFTLDESMKTVIEIEPTLDALVDSMKEKLRDLWHFEKSDVSVEYYCFDKRIMWSCWIVTIKDFGVYGFTDGPVSK